jgi:hypothetical protein
MINEIDAVPDEKINEGRKYVCTDFLLEIHVDLFPVFQFKHTAKESLQHTNNNSKKNRKEYESYQLMINRPMHEIQSMNGYTHHMRHKQTNDKVERQPGNEKVVK